MHMINRLVTILVFAWLIPVAAAWGDTSAVQWPVYRGDAIGYFQSGLPDPVVIYVYTSEGELVGIVDPHGHSDAQAMRKVGEAIAQEKFAQPSGRPLGDVATSLAAFLQDQGFQVRDIASRKSKYTLLLVMQQVKPTDCPDYRDVETRFKQIVAEAARGRDGGVPLYALAALEIGSPKMTLKCKGKQS